MTDIRSIQENALFHSLCGQFAKQRAWAGKMRATDEWKRLIVDQFGKEHGGAPSEVVPSLDGERVVILGEQTRKMSKSRMADLITFTMALAYEMDIHIPAHMSYEENYREAVR